MQQHFPGKKVEEYRRMLGSFGVIGDLALQQVSFYPNIVHTSWLETVQDFFVGADNQTAYASSVYVPVISKTLEHIETFNTNYKDSS